MLNEDLHWLAGWLEGEGSFMAGPPSAPNQPRIQVVTTDEDVAHRAGAIMGATPRLQASLKPEWKDTWLLRIKGRKAIEIMSQLRPLLGVRRQAQVDAAIESWSGWHGQRVLTPEQADEVRTARGQRSAKVVAAEFGISSHLVYSIWEGRKYA